LAASVATGCGAGYGRNRGFFVFAYSWRQWRRIPNCAENTRKEKETQMVSYPVHTIESAPEGSKPALEQLQQAFGFVPNLVGAIPNSPILIHSLVGLFQKVHGGSFTEAEIQILLLSGEAI
jgi:hypothetical protein